MERDDAIPDSFAMHNGVIKVVVPDSRKALAKISANYYGNPSRTLEMVGVTGTNGKTTTTHLIKSILEAAGKKVGLIGTIEYKIGMEALSATHTTPESLELNELLALMLERGCSSVSMEVSSHALHQSRVHGLKYDVAVFTNLSQDHLDYHGTMEEYFKAKQSLFEMKPTWVVSNIDDEWGNRIATSASGNRVTYGASMSADVRPSSTELSIDGTKLQLRHANETTSISSGLVGRFNVYNIMAAFSAGLALGLSKPDILRGIEDLKNVKGRFERVTSPKGWSAIIDYAHTPDALEKCLRAIHDVMPKSNRGRIITVFGAGGDRDRTKRPLMGKIASGLSDVTIVTSDNPRMEDPERIIDEIFTGIENRSHVKREADRKKAIQQASETAVSGDVILVAGKGHEEYQVIGKEKIHFSDREVVEACV
jgi:UDP-N-acetylmuramoyl-L-alanyl-D-glutamate--2,6-diaminopimelate ligase